MSFFSMCVFFLHKISKTKQHCLRLNFFASNQIRKTCFHEKKCDIVDRTTKLEFTLSLLNWKMAWPNSTLRKHLSFFLQCLWECHLGNSWSLVSSLDEASKVVKYLKNLDTQLPSVMGFDFQLLVCLHLNPNLTEFEHTKLCSNDMLNAKESNHLL